jgi:acyl-CoA reductase-like NAD-dependent aldehyde dehydrogenase
MAELVRAELRNADDAGALAARLAAAVPAAARPTYARERILYAAAAAVERDAEGFARLIVDETGKPLKEARREGADAVSILRASAAEARKIGGEVLPLDLEPGFEGRYAVVRRVARGPALFASSHHFPLALPAGRIGAAVAVGLPFALMSDPRAPRTAARLVETLLSAGWPAEAAVLASGDASVRELLSSDERIAIRDVAIPAGAAGILVGSDADLPWAAARCAWSACVDGGQAGVSVLRIFVEKSAHADFRKLLVSNVRELKAGDPADEGTDVGPMIDEASAARLEEALKEAVASGAKLWAGGARTGARVPPTLIENVRAGASLLGAGIFGPVAVLEAVDSRERALDRIADGADGRKAGIFTNDLAFSRRAEDRLPSGAVVLNDVPAARDDIRAMVASYTAGRTEIFGGNK